MDDKQEIAQFVQNSYEELGSFEELFLGKPFEQFNINTATGEVLDKIATLNSGVQRQGETCEECRERVIALVVSKMTPEGVYQLPSKVYFTEIKGELE